MRPYLFSLHSLLSHACKQSHFLASSLFSRDVFAKKRSRFFSRQPVRWLARNNCCLVGPPGVGKTAVVEGLAQRIAQGKVRDMVWWVVRWASSAECGEGEAQSFGITGDFLEILEYTTGRLGPRKMDLKLDIYIHNISYSDLVSQSRNPSKSARIFAVFIKWAAVSWDFTTS